MIFSVWTKQFKVNVYHLFYRVKQVPDWQKLFTLSLIKKTWDSKVSLMHTNVCEMNWIIYTVPVYHIFCVEISKSLPTLHDWWQSLLLLIKSMWILLWVKQVPFRKSVKLRKSTSAKISLLIMQYSTFFQKSFPVEYFFLLKLSNCKVHNYFSLINIFFSKK